MTTKPVISYLINYVTPTYKQASVVVKRDGTLYSNKQELTDYVDQLYVHPQSNTYVFVKCSCNKEYAFTTKNDVPSTDLDCTCGNKLFKYAST